MSSDATQSLAVFLGAGVSTCIGIPTMGAFADALRDARILSAADQAELDRIQEQCNQMATVIDGSARNLEYLASFLDTLRLVRPEYRFVGNRRFRSPRSALRLVLGCIGAMASKSAELSMLNPMRVLLELSQRVRLAIITTNYDMHVEFAARYANIKIYPGDKVLAASSCPASDPLNIYASELDAALSLFKLHGSVNWQGDSRTMKVESRIVPHYSRNRSQPSEYRNGFQRIAKYDPVSVRRQIVPPTVLKPQVDGAFEEQWMRAGSAIRGADRLWFIGYGFPATDTFMRYFFASTLFDSPRLRQIVVVNPDASAVDRARSIFDSPHHREVFSVISDVRWESLNTQAILDDRLDQAVQHYVNRGRDYIQQQKLVGALSKWVERELRS